MQNNISLKLVIALTIFLSAGSAFGAQSPWGKAASKAISGATAGVATVGVATLGAHDILNRGDVQNLFRDVGTMATQVGTMVNHVDQIKNGTPSASQVICTGLCLGSAWKSIEEFQKDNYEKAAGLGVVSLLTGTVATGAVEPSSCGIS